MDHGDKVMVSMDECISKDELPIGDREIFDVGQARDELYAVADDADGSVDDREQAAEETPGADPDGQAVDASDENEPGRAYDDGSVGLGIDIVEVERMRALLERSPHFADRVFSPDECAYCRSMANPATHFALRFAAKEAVLKALGTGFSRGVDVRDIEVGRMASGKPRAILAGRAREIAEEMGVRSLEISLSYTHTEAVACALAVTESSLEATEKRKDPMEELAMQFKEMRGMLDEI